MTSYKDSLNLPFTTFPMKADLVKREPEILAAWEAQDLQAKIDEVRQNAPRFVLHDGPPYANGHLHCGHALNKILKDIINKSKLLSGFNVYFLPGWDCHGLPIELNVEQALKKAGKVLDAKAFREECSQYATGQIAIQKTEFQRLGILGDWDHPYTTMDSNYEANIVRALGRVIENGHLQQGFKPVHWCIQCGSALAEAEVDFEDKESAAIDVAFIAVAPKEFLSRVNSALPEKKVIVPIWTTTPWSLPGNEAVCLNPNLIYALVESGECYFLIAEPLVPAVSERYNLENPTVVGQALGQAFEYLKLNHPLNNTAVPIILGEHVTTEAGTGCVHTAPAHGPDDYQVGLAYQLPLFNPVKANGCYLDEVPLVGGMFVWKANNKIVELLQERGMLLHHTTIRHSYAHCWRHKTPMIFLATPQWFISMDKNGLRQSILQEIMKVDWLPSWGKSRMLNMIKNRPDWCISRQRNWGTPLPLIIHKESKALHPRMASLIEDIAKIIEDRGAQAWFELDLNTLLGKGSEAYEKISDTLDVWFDSGVSHYCVLASNPRLGVPADLYLEGSDQYRGWFNSSLTTAVAMYGHAPYKTVLSHGYTVDQEGKKLSKSKGNYIELGTILNQYGADILRLWVASTDYRTEVSISEEIIKRNVDIYRRIRNTARFLLANLFDYDVKAHHIKPSEWVELDAWALRRAEEIQREIIEAYESYNFHLVFQRIHHFCAIDMGSFYLDIIKDRQYTTAKDSLARRSCQTAMYHIIQALTRWLAPILSFTAEEIWKALPIQSKEPLLLVGWYAQWPKVTIESDKATWQTIHSIRDAVNKALEEKRKNGVIGSGLAAEVTLYVNENVFHQLARLGDELRFILITSMAKLERMPRDLTTLEHQMSDEGLICDKALDLAILVKPTSHEKCERCWHRVADVGTDDTYPSLCKRCIGNITGQGETRVFA
ncbi:MAG: isoleucine--tRNA ligase [Legionella sp.]|nr:isoleucine--tRNA ligase [Legionella sp.]